MMGKSVALSWRMSVSQKILKQVFDDPAADHGIVRHDQDRDHGVDPAAERQPLPLAKMAVSAHRAFAGHPAQRRFGNDHGVAKGDSQQDVDEQKNAAAVFCGQMFPNPTDAPAADSTNPSLPENALRLC